MNPCEKYELWINLYVDDMLPSEEVRPLQEHLKKCGACREYCAHLSEMKAALGSMEEPVPEGLHEQIMSYVEKNGSASESASLAAPVKPKKPVKRWLSQAAAVAACAILAVTAVHVIPSMDPTGGAVRQDSETAYEATAPELRLPGENREAEENAPEPPKPKPNELKQDAVLTEPETAEPESPAPDMLSEDLPPLGVREDEANDAMNPSSSSVRAWIRVRGDREDLPEWVDFSGFRQVEINGKATDCITIADWAEEYWVDQLEASGFQLKPMDDQTVSDQGEYIVLVFDWKSIS